MQYKTLYRMVFINNLHFYPFLSASFVGRNFNTCSYAIKSHNQKHCIILCILIHIIEMSELKPIIIIINNTHHYMYKKHYSEQLIIRQIFGVLEVFHNICNMYSQDLHNILHLLSSGKRYQPCAYISGKSLLPMLHTVYNMWLHSEHSNTTFSFYFFIST